MLCVAQQQGHSHSPSNLGASSSRRIGGNNGPVKPGHAFHCISCLITCSISLNMHRRCFDLGVLLLCSYPAYDVAEVNRSSSPLPPLSPRGPAPLLLRGKGIRPCFAGVVQVMPVWQESDGLEFLDWQQLPIHKIDRAADSRHVAQRSALPQRGNEHLQPWRGGCSVAQQRHQDLWGRRDVQCCCK